MVLEIWVIGEAVVDVLIEKILELLLICQGFCGIVAEENFEGEEMAD